MIPNTIYVGLDIGTTKVCAVVASADPGGRRIDIIGKGLAESEGLKRGVVTNIPKTVDAIKSAVAMAEQQAGVRIKRVLIGIAGDHIQTFTTRAMVSVSSPAHEITETDVTRLLENARLVKIDNDRTILHVIPQDYSIDGQDGITDPVGMSGIRLEADVLVITGSLTAIENMHRCATRAGLEVESVVLQPLASAYAVLDDAERELGVALIDIGGGTTDIAVFKDNIIRFTNIFAIAGNKVTDDIAEVLAIRSVEAERIKVEYGHTIADSIIRDEMFQVPGVGGRRPTEVTKSLLCQIIEPRMEEMFEFALHEIMKSGLAHKLNAGIVITGGCSLLRGADELAQRVFNMPVKIGIPAGFSVNGFAPEVQNPMYATAVGLIHFAVQQMVASHRLDATQQQDTTQTNAQELMSVEVQPSNGNRQGLLSKVKTWLDEL